VPEFTLTIKSLYRSSSLFLISMVFIETRSIFLNLTTLEVVPAKTVSTVKFMTSSSSSPSSSRSVSYTKNAFSYLESTTSVSNSSPSWEIVNNTLSPSTSICSAVMEKPSGRDKDSPTLKIYSSSSSSSTIYSLIHILLLSLTITA